MSEADIKIALKQATVKGRVELVKVSDKFTLMIDYAHNAMSLESLLTTLKEYEPADWSASLAVAETVPKPAALRWQRFPEDWLILRSSLPIIPVLRSRRTS